jgi:hypothetical protein
MRSRALVESAPEVVPMREARKRSLTARVRLPGGQERLRQMILYIATRCETAPRFGSTKLNKILWKADFDAFAARGRPVTGRHYQRLPLGPAPKEMKPLHREMVERGDIRIEKIHFDYDITEDRTIPLIPYDISQFDEDDIAFVEASITYYWHLNARETSDDSHGVAWKTHNNGDILAYELARLSDKPLTEAQRSRLMRKAYKMGWATH